MWTQGDDFDGSLWFFTSDEAPKVEELERNPHVCLSYAAPDKDLYVSVSGRAELVHDEAKAKELWNVYAEAWFPQGVDDPHLALLRVDVEQALLAGQEAEGAQFAEIVVGAVTGKPPKSGEEGKLDFGS